MLLHKRLPIYTFLLILFPLLPPLSSLCTAPRRCFTHFHSIFRFGLTQPFDDLLLSAKKKPKKKKNIYIYMIDPGSWFAAAPPPMVRSQNLRFAAFRMKTRNLQCFLHGGWLARSANLQIRRISATSLPKTCYLQNFGFDIVE